MCNEYFVQFKVVNNIRYELSLHVLTHYFMGAFVFSLSVVIIISFIHSIFAHSCILFPFQCLFTEYENTIPTMKSNKSPTVSAPSKRPGGGSCVSSVLQRIDRTRRSSGEPVITVIAHMVRRLTAISKLALSIRCVS